MYNRYVPQADGSYRRNRVPEPHRPKPAPQPPQQPAPPKPSPQPACPPPPKPPCKNPEMPKPCAPQGSSVGGFLRQLLPKDFDTVDLIVVLLLLLMAGDCEEDRSNALLTLALYFFM